MARTGNPADLMPRQLKALRGALEHSVTIQLTRLQELMDDLVARGSLTRAEADSIVSQLVTTSKAYSQALLDVLEAVTAESRKLVEAGLTAVDPVVSAAGKLADSVRKKTKPALVSVPVADPVPDLDDLTVPQVRTRLAALSPAELRRVRQAEVAGKARKGVLGEIDKLLGS